MLPHKIAFVDLETSGSSLRSDSIIEIGIVVVEDNKITQTFQSVVNPQRPVSEMILSMTGISRAEIAAAPSFYQLKDQILELLDDAVLVAHNVRFDYGFLVTEFKRLDIDFSKKHFCTVRLSRHLYPEHHHHNLDALIQRHNLNCPNRHRAFDDAHVLWQFIQHIQQEFPEEILNQALSQVLKKPSMPIKISLEKLEKLPELPGVYIFYGENQLPLYVGKSINIKERVMSHFSQSHRNSTELKISQQIERIETIVTAGELGALLTESRMIKELQPLYNRRLRLARKLVVGKRHLTSDNYYTIKIEQIDHISVEDMNEIVATFKNPSQAKRTLLEVCKVHQLCPKLLGLEKGSGPCFQKHLGHCLGGCIGLEKAALYNFRFLQAFSKTSIQQWPYAQPILIEEEFVVDKWCVLGQVKVEDQDTNIKLSDSYTFDLDMYKILASYLKKKNTKIKPIRPEIMNYLRQTAII